MYKLPTISKFHLLLIISIIAVLLLLMFSYKQYIEKSDIQSQLEAVNDTMIVYKTKEGKNAAEIKVLKGTKSQLLEIVKIKDKEVYNLIKSTKNVRTITKLNTETRIDTVTKVDTLIVKSGDSLTKDSVYITKNIKNDYYTADIKVVNDSLSLGLKVKNDFKIIGKEKSNGLFKRNTLVIDVINENPYTYSTELTSYEITPKKKVLPKILLIAGSIAAILILK